MHGFALTTFTPSLNFLPCWHECTAKQVHRAMLCLRMAPTLNVCKLAEQGFLWCKNAKLSYRGIPPWRKYCPVGDFIPMSMAVCQHPDRPLQLKTSSREESMLKPLGLWLACPSCGYWSDVHKITLLRRGRWRGIRCTRCNGSRVSSKWKCACGRRWATCEIHSIQGRACGTVKSLTTTTDPKRPCRGFDVD